MSWWKRKPIRDKEVEDWAQNKFHGILSKGELQLMKDQLGNMVALEAEKPGWWSNDHIDCMPAWRYAMIICRRQENLSHGDFKVMKAIEQWVKTDLKRIASRYAKS